MPPHSRGVVECYACGAGAKDGLHLSLQSSLISLPIVKTVNQLIHRVTQTLQTHRQCEETA